LLICSKSLAFPESEIRESVITRRDFCKTIAALAGQSLLLPLAGYLPVGATQLVPVPPALMLHSVDGRFDFLPPLLDRFNQHGFQTTTYQAWYRQYRQQQPVANPMIISIDDISLAERSSPAFNTFVRMKNWLSAAGMTAVYGVITEPVVNDQPQRQQDETRWDMMQAWVEEGFELASHTSYHSNFNAVDTGPRPDFTAVDYEAEIVRSARLIETKLGERGLTYQVQTLITPYGSGYAYQLPAPDIHPGIRLACQQTNIKFVVGIAQGRSPLPLSALLDDNQLVYTGRTGPVYVTDEETGGIRPFLPATWSLIEAWWEQNCRYETDNEPPTIPESFPYQPV
jgi:peptidoglycan/xylan/chitin deacetylase (PgdA/CDA1 family)